MYEGKQKVDTFLEALKCIKEKKSCIYKRLRVNFYGEFSFFLDKKIKKLKLNEIVFQKGKRNRSEILNIQQNTDILKVNFRLPPWAEITYLFQFFFAIFLVVQCRLSSDRRQ